MKPCASIYAFKDSTSRQSIEYGSTPPFFSVIIPTHNRAKLLCRAVDSVLAQTYSQFEALVVDDGSTDNTRLVSGTYHDTRLRFFHCRRAGVSVARNYGVKKSCGSHIVFLDSDDQWHPDKLQRHSEFINAYPQYRIHQTKENWIRDGKPVAVNRKFQKKNGCFFDESLKRCMITPSSVCMERAFFEELGGFDERLPACEDYDLWLRVGDREPVGLIDDRLLNRYSGHEGQLSGSYPAMDRFRLYSLLQCAHASRLSKLGRTRVHAMAQKKSHILWQGRVKRDIHRNRFSDLLYKFSVGEALLENDASDLRDYLLNVMPL